MSQPTRLCLYERVLGDEYQRLHPVLQAYHRAPPPVEGEMTVERPRGWLRGLAASLMKLPKASTRENCTLTIEATDGTETWRRSIGAWQMTTYQHEENNRLIEKVGPMKFVFALKEEESALVFSQIECRLARLKLPKACSPWIWARACGTDEGWQVRVEIGLAPLGLLCAYEGRMRYKCR